MQTQSWPRKTRDIHNHHMDSTIWDDLKFRDDDIVISTYAKSGTTWMQQIVGQITHGGDPELDVASMSPWLDLRVPPKEIKLPEVEAQTHRRFLKTHLPFDALVYSPNAKYIYVGRDPRDVVWSFYNHHLNSNEVLYDALNNTPGLVGPKFEPPGLEIHDYWRRWLKEDGFPIWSFWENAQSWWSIRGLPNLLFVHFADLKRDLPGEMKRIAAFLDVEIDDAKWPSIIEYCTFDWMKANAHKTAPGGGMFWEGGANTFINKGVNGRWSDTLTAEDNAEYEALANQNLGAECADWFASGGPAS
jgi:aryl sulfotransferase